MQRVTASVPAQTSGVDDLFAPGSFISLTKAESLNRPAFENLPAGVVSSGGADRTGATRPQATKPQVFRKVKGEGWGALGLSALVAREFPGILLSMVAARDAASVVATEAAVVSVGAETWVSTHDGVAHGHATGAFQAAKVSGQPSAFAVAAADLAAPAVLGGCDARLRRVAAAAPHGTRDGPARLGAADREAADHAP